MNSKKIVYPELDLISFHDAPVLGMKLNLDTKEFSISLDDSYLRKPNGIELEGPGVLTIQNWQSFKSDVFTVDDQLYEGFDELREICRFNITSDKVQLEGFGKKTHHWIRYFFTKPEVYFTFSENAKAG